MDVQALLLLQPKHLFWMYQYSACAMLGEWWRQTNRWLTFISNILSLASVHSVRSARRFTGPLWPMKVSNSFAEATCMIFSHLNILHTKLRPFWESNPISLLLFLSTLFIKPVLIRPGFSVHYSFWPMLNAYKVRLIIIQLIDIWAAIWILRSAREPYWTKVVPCRLHCVHQLRTYATQTSSW